MKVVKLQAPLIASFGLYWDRYAIDSGGTGRGNQGRMLGFPYSAPAFERHVGLDMERTRGQKIDPRPPIVDHRLQAGIYVLYSESYTPIYVGQAGGRSEQRSLWSRLVEHHKKPGETTTLKFRTWRWFSWFGVVPADWRSARQYYRCKPTDRQEDTVIELLKKERTLQVDWRTAVDHLEAALITTMDPNANKKGGTWSDAVEYLQVRYRKSQYEYLLGPCHSDGEGHGPWVVLTEPVESALDDL